MALTDRQCRTLVCTQKTTRIADGEGLSLVLHKNGSKYWHGRYREGGKEKTKSLGMYPDVGLAQARKLWQSFKDTLSHHKPARATFAEVYSRYCEWRIKKGATSSRTLTWAYAMLPEWFVNSYVDDIKRAVVDELLQAEVARGRKTSHIFLHSTISQVMDFAVDIGYIEYNSIARLHRLLPTYATEHRASMSKRHVGLYIHRLNTYRAHHRCIGEVIVPLYMKLCLLTATRRNELAKINLSELDLDNALWVIPEHRMKMKRKHIVPLSTQAVFLFKRLIELANGHELLFRSLSGGKHIVDVHVGKIHRSLANEGINHCLHGNRALFATVAQEELGFAYAIADMQLSHQKATDVERAYNRATFVEQRADLMQQWADWIDAQAMSFEGSVGGILYPYY